MLQGDLVVLSWLYPRRGSLDARSTGVRGHMGQTHLSPEAAEDDDQEKQTADYRRQRPTTKPASWMNGGSPHRQIYCVDLRAAHQAQAFVEEIKRLVVQNALRQRPTWRQLAARSRRRQQLRVTANC